MNINSIDLKPEATKKPALEPAIPQFDIRLEEFVRDGVGNSRLFHELKEDGMLMSIGTYLAKTTLAQCCPNSENAWASHLFMTKDFATVITDEIQVFLRPINWIGRFNSPSGSKDILILLSGFEVDHLMKAFQESFNATLYMYNARSKEGETNMFHMQITGMATKKIDIEDEVQIAVLAGSLYFEHQAELNANCRFLGLFPRPYTYAEEVAYSNHIIDKNGFIPVHKRQNQMAIDIGGNECKFNENPASLVTKLVENHHGTRDLHASSHVALIVNRNMKVCLNEIN